MRTVPPALQAKLDAGVTTLARCWVVTRRDGVVIGFTDHDQNLALGEVVCRADTGLAAAEATARLGLSVDGGEVAGALVADALTEADLAAGRFDAATIDLHLVDWNEPALTVHLARGVVGEVRRSGEAFTAEWRSLAHRLAEESGRRYTATCDADLGDARCGVDLGAAAFGAAGTVTTVVGRSLLAVAGLDDFDDGWFTAGRLVVTGGADAGFAVEVKLHRAGDAVTLELWQALPEPVAPGDGFTVTAGCDKCFATCRDRFANAANFRGFPHIPGNDFVVAYAVAGEGGNDGGSMQGG